MLIIRSAPRLDEPLRQYEHVTREDHDVGRVLVE